MKCLSHILYQIAMPRLRQKKLAYIDEDLWLACCFIPRHGNLVEKHENVRNGGSVGSTEHYLAPPLTELNIHK